MFEFVFYVSGLRVNLLAILCFDHWMAVEDKSEHHKQGARICMLDYQNGIQALYIRPEKDEVIIIKKTP